MRGCMRKLAIFVGILIIVAVLVGLATWAYWERGLRLSDQVRDAYYEGKAVEALALYHTLEKQYPPSWEFFEDFAQRLNYYVPVLEAYLRAVDLQKSGQAGEAIAAYESFLDEYGERRETTHLYLSLTREALAHLRLEQALALQDGGDYAVATQVYQSLLAMNTIGGPECAPRRPEDIEGEACQQADMAIEESQAQARAAIPLLFQAWTGALEQQMNYQEYVEGCRAILQAYPDLLQGEEAQATLAEAYSGWAAQLREVEDFERAIEQYQVILREFSDTPAATQAKVAIAETRQELAAWREKNPAVPTVEFPQEVSRNADGRWSWTILFKETGGKVGYTLDGEGWIVDTQGRRYGPWGTLINRGSVTVSAGGQAEDSYWCRGDTYADGHAVFTWSGRDATGHSITIEEKVHLLP